MRRGFTHRPQYIEVAATRDMNFGRCDMQQRTAWLAAALVVMTVLPAAAAAPCRTSTPSFERWLEDFKKEAVAEGVSRRVVDSALAGVTSDPAIISKDRGQGVFSQSFLQFAGRMADGYRVGTGSAKLKQHAATLAQAEQQFGVPPQPIVAFWALETDFGANNGNLPVLRSLLTLAYDCRRPDMFREELIYALKVVERGDLSPAEMAGAWAGEIGQTQFSPKAYFKYATDFDGDGRRDLIHSAPDVIASSAKLLAENGWKRGQPWLQEVRVPQSLPWDQADLAIKHPRSQWAKWGVTQANGAALPNDDMPASLLLLMGRNGPAFLAYENFNAFLEWNQSLVYATTAAYLATRLAGAPKVSPGRGAPPVLSAQEVTELQRQLARHGYEVGKIDGKAGLATRAAVKQAQVKLGMPADSYPTVELIARLGGSTGGGTAAAPSPAAPAAAPRPKQASPQAPKQATPQAPKQRAPAPLGQQ
jgi:lytic murein transglycosylase